MFTDAVIYFKLLEISTPCDLPLVAELGYV
jgi:hypothetical protein